MSAAGTGQWTAQWLPRWGDTNLQHIRMYHENWNKNKFVNNCCSVSVMLKKPCHIQALH